MKSGMKTRSAKAKGRRLQKWVAADLIDALNVAEGDARSSVMGESGRDVPLSPHAELFCPFDIECKNQEKLNIWAAIAQAEANTGEGRWPLVVFKRNYSKPYAVLRWQDLAEILSVLARGHVFSKEDQTFRPLD